jgi:Fe2+ or Zn2+ uptake regulation protein
VSHQAVYDVLRALTDAGLVRRIQPSGSVGGRTLDQLQNLESRAQVWKRSINQVGKLALWQNGNKERR